MSNYRATGGTGRVRILDMLRGFSVLSMVLYHGVYDLVYLFDVYLDWYIGIPGYIWQQSICWLFILVSGASLHYGSRPVRRGFLVFGCGLLMTVATLLFMPGQRILFGILHFMGIAMLLAVALMPFLQRLPPAVGLAVSFALFVLLRCVPRGYIGLLDFPLWQLPGALYATPVLFPLGLPGPGFWSSDYFPLIPWFFLFISGYFAWALVKERAVYSFKKANILEWIGRRSLWIYVLHQPVLYGVLWLLAQMGLLGQSGTVV